MTVEEQKAVARKEKETIVQTMINFNPQRSKDELMGKTLKQLRKMYEDTFKNKWVYDAESA